MDIEGTEMGPDWRAREGGREEEMEGGREGGRYEGRERERGEGKEGGKYDGSTLPLLLSLTV